MELFRVWRPRPPISDPAFVGDFGTRAEAEEAARVYSEGSAPCVIEVATGELDEARGFVVDGDDAGLFVRGDVEEVT